MFQYVEIEVGERKMSVKQMYAEEMQNLINDIVILSKLKDRVTIQEINEETSISTMYGFEIKIDDKNSMYFCFDSVKPSYSKDNRDRKIIDSFYCDYSEDMKKNFMFKNDFSIQQKKHNNSLQTVSFAGMIKVLDKIKEIIVQL